LGTLEVPGQIAAYVYQMDRDRSEYYLAVIFESRETYHANAASPEQHERRSLMRVLESRKWNDGEIVSAIGV
jgi:heme-degrading monooxygenase HmoA